MPTTPEGSTETSPPSPLDEFRSYLTEAGYDFKVGLQDNPRGFGTFAGDVGRGLLVGGANAVRMVGDTATLGYLDIDPIYPGYEHKIAGGLAEGVGRFGTLALAAGPAVAGGLTAAGVTGVAGSRVGVGVLSGAVADFVGQGRDEELLSNFLIEQDNPLLNNAVTQALAAKESDGRWTRKFKSMLEGGVLGLGIDGLVALVKSVKKTRSGVKTDAVQEAFGQQTQVAFASFDDFPRRTIDAQGRLQVPTPEEAHLIEMGTKLEKRIEAIKRAKATETFPSFNELVDTHAQIFKRVVDLRKARGAGSPAIEGLLPSAPVKAAEAPATVVDAPAPDVKAPEVTPPDLTSLAETALAKSTGEIPPLVVAAESVARNVERIIDDAYSFGPTKEFVGPPDPLQVLDIDPELERATDLTSSERTGKSTLAPATPVTKKKAKKPAAKTPTAAEAAPTATTKTVEPEVDYGFPRASDTAEPIYISGPDFDELGMDYLTNIEPFNGKWSGARTAQGVEVRLLASKNFKGARKVLKAVDPTTPGARPVYIEEGNKIFLAGGPKPAGRPGVFLNEKITADEAELSNYARNAEIFSSLSPQHRAINTLIEDLFPARTEAVAKMLVRHVLAQSDLKFLDRTFFATLAPNSKVVGQATARETKNGWSYLVSVMGEMPTANKMLTLYHELYHVALFRASRSDQANLVKLYLAAKKSGEVDAFIKTILPTLSVKGGAPTPGQAAEMTKYFADDPIEFMVEYAAWATAHKRSPTGYLGRAAKFIKQLMADIFTDSATSLGLNKSKNLAEMSKIMESLAGFGPNARTPNAGRSTFLDSLTYLTPEEFLQQQSFGRPRLDAQDLIETLRKIMPDDEFEKVLQEAASKANGPSPILEGVRGASDARAAAADPVGARGQVERVVRESEALSKVIQKNLRNPLFLKTYASDRVNKGLSEAAEKLEALQELPPSAQKSAAISDAVQGIIETYRDAESAVRALSIYGSASGRLLKSFDAEHIRRMQAYYEAQAAGLESAIKTLQRDGVLPPAPPVGILTAAEEQTIELVAKQVETAVNAAKTPQEAAEAVAKAVQADGLSTNAKAALQERLKSDMNAPEIPKDAEGAILGTDGNLNPQLAKVIGEAAENYKGISVFAELVRRGKATDEELAAVLMSFRADPKKAREMVQLAAKNPTLFDKYLEFWMSGLLSGVRTLATNVFSNILQTIVMPAKFLAGGDVRRALSLWTAQMSVLENTFRAAKAGETYAGLTTPLQAATQAFDLERGVLDVADTKDLPRRAIGGTAGRIIRLPLRLMGATDEYFKQLNYQAYLTHYATEEASRAVAQGRIASKDFRAYADTIVSSGFFANGQAAVNRQTGAPLFQEAFEFAETSTFSRSLDAQDSWVATLGSGAQRWAQAAPGIRLFLPFIRTPTNILREAIAYTPGMNLSLKDFRADFNGRNGAAKQAAARGQMVMGTGAFFLMGMAASSGMVTGSGPKNPEERKRLTDMGWRPYSFRVPQDDGSYTYISYQKLEPFATIIGLAADVIAVAEEADAIGDPTLQQQVNNIAGNLVFITTRNLSNKTYLMGLKELLDVFGSGDARVLERALQTRLASHIPAVLSNVPDLQEQYGTVRGPLDALVARLPGGNDRLEPRRNIFGEVVASPSSWTKLSPMIVSNEKRDAIDEEVAALSFGFRLPGEVWNGIDLTTIRNSEGRTAYDALNAEVASIRVNGKSLRDVLNTLVTSEDYKRLPMPRSDSDTENLRIQAIQKILGTFRRAAMARVQQKFPQIVEERRKALNASRPKFPPRTADQILSPVNRTLESL